MKYLRTGFSHIDKNIDGLKQGTVYFVSALDRENTRSFAASLCASINSFTALRAIFYTDSTIPYCHCEHVHFESAKNFIDFLHSDLISSKTHEFTNTDVYLFEDFDLLSISTIKTWPSDMSVRKQSYENYLYSIQKLAKEYQVAIVLTDQLYQDNDDPNGLNCDFPAIRYKQSEGTFHLAEQEDGALAVRYLNHHTHDSFSFHLKSSPKEIKQVYPAYVELK